MTSFSALVGETGLYEKGQMPGPPNRVPDRGALAARFAAQLLEKALRLLMADRMALRHSAHPHVYNHFARDSSIRFLGANVF